MIVTIKSNKKPSEFYKQSDGRFTRFRFNKGKDYLTPWLDSYGILRTGLTQEDEVRLGEILDKNLKVTSSFWSDYKVMLTDKPLILDTSRADEELKYLVLKEHFRVAKNPLDKNPLSEYVIYNSTDEAKRNNATADIKVKAYTLFAKLTESDRRNILKLYPGYSRTDNVDSEIIQSNLINEIEKNYKKFIDLAEDKNLNSKVLIEELVSANVIKKNKNMYKYGEDVLGHDIDSTIEHLNDPKNQGLKIALMQELKSNKKTK